MIENKLTVLTGVDGQRTVFRSRLEARWSRAFDYLSLPWQYEPFKFVLDDKGLTYTPDFQVDGIGLIEVKPNFAALAESADRIDRFVEKTGERVYLLYGGKPAWGGVMILHGNPLAGWKADRMEEAIILGGKAKRQFAKEHFGLFQDFVTNALERASNEHLSSDPISTGEVLRYGDVVERSEVNEARGRTILRRILKKAGEKSAA